MDMPQRTAITAETVTAWTARLTTEAEGLDFNDPEDRVVFRTRVAHATGWTKVVCVRELAKHFGRAPRSLTRDAASLALANAWIARTTGATVCKAAAC